jgi:hypothetical protein
MGYMVLPSAQLLDQSGYNLVKLFQLYVSVVVVSKADSCVFL